MRPHRTDEIAPLTDFPGGTNTALTGQERRRPLSSLDGSLNREVRFVQQKNA
jgi:hypothetical protein